MEAQIVETCINEGTLVFNILLAAIVMFVAGVGLGIKIASEYRG